MQLSDHAHAGNESRMVSSIQASSLCSRVPHTRQYQKQKLPLQPLSHHPQMMRICVMISKCKRTAYERPQESPNSKPPEFGAINKHMAYTKTKMFNESDRQTVGLAL